MECRTVIKQVIIMIVYFVVMLFLVSIFNSRPINNQSYISEYCYNRETSHPMCKSSRTMMPVEFCIDDRCFY